MTELSEMLEKLGLSQYLDVFVDEGFDSWQTVMDITESDLYVACGRIPCFWTPADDLKRCVGGQARSPKGRFLAPPELQLFGLSNRWVDAVSDFHTRSFNAPLPNPKKPPKIASRVICPNPKQKKNHKPATKARSLQDNTREAPVPLLRAKQPPARSASIDATLK